MIERINSEFVEQLIHSANIIPEEKKTFLEDESALTLYERYIKGANDRFYKLDVSDDRIFESTAFALSLKAPLFTLVVIPQYSDAVSNEVKNAMRLAKRIGSLKMSTVTNTIKKPILIIGRFNAIGEELFDPDLMIGIIAKAMKRRAKTQSRSYAR